MTISSSWIKSSILNSEAANTISDRRSSPYFSRITSNSSLTIFIRNSRLSRIERKRSISCVRSEYSSSIFCCSMLVKRCNVMDKMACTWRSDNRRFSTASSSSICVNARRASLVSFEPRIMRITSSILSCASINPSRICARSSATRSSYSVRRFTTSWRWSI